MFGRSIATHIPNIQKHTTQVEQTPSPRNWQPFKDKKGGTNTKSYIHEVSLCEDRYFAFVGCDLTSAHWSMECCNAVICWTFWNDAIMCKCWYLRWLLKPNTHPVFVCDCVFVRVCVFVWLCFSVLVSLWVWEWICERVSVWVTIFFLHKNGKLAIKSLVNKYLLQTTPNLEDLQELQVNTTKYSNTFRYFPPPVYDFCPKSYNLFIFLDKLPKNHHLNLIMTPPF